MRRCARSFWTSLRRINQRFDQSSHPRSITVADPAMWDTFRSMWPTAPWRHGLLTVTETLALRVGFPAELYTTLWMA